LRYAKKILWLADKNLLETCFIAGSMGWVRAQRNPSNSHELTIKGAKVKV